MSIYDELQGVARDVLTEFQQGAISYVVVTPGSGPVDNPGVATETPYTIVGTANGVSTKYVMQSLAIASDLQVVAPADPRYTPKQADKITVDGIPYKIVQIIKKPAAGITVAFLFIIRKGG